MADDRTHDVAQNSKANIIAHEDLQAAEGPFEPPEPPLPPSSTSDPVIAEPEQPWSDVWRLLRNSIDPTCVLRCSAALNGTFELVVEPLSDPKWRTKYESLVEQRCLDSIPELPDDYIVLFMRPSLSYLTDIRWRETFPNLERFLYRSIQNDPGIEQRLMLLDLPDGSRDNMVYRWHETHSAMLKGNFTETLANTRAVLPLHLDNWTDEIGTLIFAHSQKVSIYEVPRLLILYHNPNSVFGDPICDRLHYRDSNGPFERLLDGLQNEADSELTPSNIPNVVMRHLHHIMLADEFEVLIRLDDSVGDIDREMADDNVLRHRLRMWPSFMAQWRPYLYDQYEKEETEMELIERAKIGLSETQPLNIRWLQQESARTKFSRAIDHVRSKRKVTLERCESTFTMLMTTMSLIESEKAIKEAEEVTKLTQLAFFFIPLTFVAGIFGMNLAAFSQRGPSVWSWAVTSIGLSFLTYCFLYYRSVLIFFQRQAKKRQARRRARAAEDADGI